MLRTSGSTKKQIRTRVEDAVNGQAVKAAIDIHDVKPVTLCLVAGGLSPFFGAGG